MAKKKNEDPQLNELMDLLREEGSIKTPEEKIGDIPRRLPEEQKFSRAVVLQSHVMQRSLFEELENSTPTQEGEVVYSKLPSLISEYDFRGYILAAQLTLYDQSYLYHNEDINSGFARDMSNISTDLGFKDEKGKPYHAGHISVTLNDLCRVAYGKEGETPTSKQRDSMRATIKAVDSTPIEINYANGDHKESYLIKVMGKYIRKEDGAETYHLVLNPIFTTAGKGYGLMLRGATTRLTQYLTSKGKTGKAGKSAAHLAFLQLLSIQEKGKDWRISVEHLLQRLNLLEYFKKNRKNVIAKLDDLFETFVGLGYLLEKPNPTIPQDGIYIFKINPDLKRKKDEDSPT